ncbi:uncharacterized protein LOC135392295 [Ornithodoros turicata]|uniref:uncharacterized protein LOC135392295 n=1 Tax=Ornithodoros turicata TaxID=34597 RepID=UPI0031387590
MDIVDTEATKSDRQSASDAAYEISQDNNRLAESTDTELADDEDGFVLPSREQERRRADLTMDGSGRAGWEPCCAVSSAGIYHFPCRDDLVRLIDACISAALEKLLRPPAPEDADAAPYPVGASPPPTVPSAPSSLSAAASGCTTPAVCPPLPPPSLPPVFHEPPPEPMVRSASQDCPSAKSVGVPSPPSPSHHKKACQVPKDLLAQIVKSSIASDGPP